MSFALAAHGKEAVPAAEDPVLEQRVMRLAEELRCLVCQNETIAASQASLAFDLRAQIRSQLQQGQSEEQVRAHLVARYGGEEFIVILPETSRNDAFVLAERIRANVAS